MLKLKILEKLAYIKKIKIKNKNSLISKRKTPLEKNKSK